MGYNDYPEPCLSSGAYLGHQGSLCGQAVLQEEGTLGAAQTVQHDL